ncbi:hypothetical protein [Acetobacter persici]|uniref:hypothetical protein n=1 Tax=Acetobacter persici TaxID=1076596 RepID=UPI0039E94B9A
MTSSLFSITLCVLAVLCSMAAGVSVYLTVARQLLLRQALPAKTGLGLSAGLAVAALWLFCQNVAMVTAVFALVVVLMTVWSLLPLCVALVRRGEEPS